MTISWRADAYGQATDQATSQGVGQAMSQGESQSITDSAGANSISANRISANSEPTSYMLFGVRIDAIAPAVVARAIFEGATDHRRLRVVLADFWSLLLAQRDFSVWESLSGADFVLPSAADAVVRRLTRRRGVPAIVPDLLLSELLLAMEHSNTSLALMAPADELAFDVGLIRRLWPRLRVMDVSMERLSDSSMEDERLAREVKSARADVLLVGGNSPWQERWSFEQRATLQVGATVLLPVVQATLAAIAQRSGMSVPAPAWMRRRAVARRAYDVTLAPTAAASARTLNELLRGPREALQQSPLAKWRLNPATLQRLSLAREARKAAKPAPVRVAEWRGSDESAIRRLTESPLARLGPPRGATPLPALPALPPPSDDMDVADQPTIRFTREELLAQVPEVVTGYIVEPSAATHSAANGASGHEQPPVDAIALGPTADDAYATAPLPKATQPIQAIQPAPRQDTPADQPPERSGTLPPPLAPTTLLPGRPQRPRQRFAASAPEAAGVEDAAAPAQPAAPAPAPTPSASIATPIIRLEELAQLKAHVQARRRLVRRRRKAKSQRPHRRENA